MKKKVGILGSGVVAKTLATGLSNLGYEVTIGTRDAGKLKEWHAQNASITIGSFEDTAQSGELIVLAVKGTAAESLIKRVGVHLRGKTVIDTTNPIAEAPPVNGVLKFFTGPNQSLLEIVQAAAPHANFVKAFNCVGSSFMINPSFPGGKPTMFIAGNNEAARQEVTQILEQINWEVSDMGKAEAARAIEPLCMLWCLPGFLNNQWTHAFKLLKR
jgi:8-hydroxy-5-deazaflavin:NADPH oxidoreductase